MFDGSERKSAQLLKILLERGAYRDYFPDPSKSLFIADLPKQEDAAKKEFEADGLNSNFAGGSWYLGAYQGTQEELEAWV